MDDEQLLWWYPWVVRGAQQYNHAHDTRSTHAVVPCEMGE
jgi:hypothetical protein